MKSFNYTSIAYVSLLAAGLLLAPGCGSKKDKDDVGGTESASQNAPVAPPEADAPPMQGPVADQMRSVPTDAAAVAKGKELFAQCGGCHGPNGDGMIGIGPRLNSASFLAAASDDMLIRTITKGRMGTAMIPWGSIMKPEEVAMVVAYMRSWAEVEAATLDETPLVGDAVAGETVFTAICSGCHGRSGAGYQETANGTGIGRKAFMSEVSNGYLRHVIKNGKSQTKMKGFAEKSRVAVANLTDKQIDDVIAHLRTSAW